MARRRIRLGASEAGVCLAAGPGALIELRSVDFWDDEVVSAAAVQGEEREGVELRLRECAYIYMG